MGFVISNSPYLPNPFLFFSGTLMLPTKFMMIVMDILVPSSLLVPVQLQVPQTNKKSTLKAPQNQKLLPFTIKLVTLYGPETSLKPKVTPSQPTSLTKTT
jgi:hypothetical protein